LLADRAKSGFVLFCFDHHIACVSNLLFVISNPLLPQESTDSLVNFGDGNKTKTITKLDQKIRQSPSQTVLRLTGAAPDSK
jgi:hypothetical protein